MKTVLKIALIFFTGFFIHAYFFPNLLFFNLPISPDKLLSSVKKTSTTSTPQDAFLTQITYNNGQFTPPRVVMKHSYYITITNGSKTESMWLVSNVKALNTDRPYFESEQLKTLLNDPGTYTVINKNNPKSELVVVVTP